MLAAVSIHLCDSLLNSAHMIQCSQCSEKKKKNIARGPEGHHHRQKHVQLARSPKTGCKKDHPDPRLNRE